MNMLNAHLYVEDDSAKSFRYKMRQDLVAIDAVETVAVGSSGLKVGNRYLVFTRQVPDDQVWLIKGWGFFVQERTDPGGQESASYIEPRLVNDWVIFEPRVGDGPPYDMDVDLNAPLQSTGALNVTSRSRGQGFTEVSLTPDLDARHMARDALELVVVPGGTAFNVLFGLMPLANANPMTQPYTVGLPAVGNTRRVDFAGAVIRGVKMPKQEYDRRKQWIARQAAKLVS